MFIISFYFDIGDLIISLNWDESVFEILDDLFLGPFLFAKMNVVLIECVPVSTHDIDSNIKEAEAIEYNCTVLSILIEVFQKLSRHVSPVDAAVNVVSDVVTIVKRILVVKVVNRLKGQSAVEPVALQVLRHGSNIWMHKDVLREVAEHQSTT